MWHARPLLDSDLDAVRSLAPTADVDDLLDGIDRDRDATIVVRDGEVVAWAVLRDGRRYTSVAATARGQGIGSWLLRWSAWRAKASGLAQVVQLSDDPDTAAWLAAHGHVNDGDRFVMPVE